MREYTASSMNSDQPYTSDAATMSTQFVTSAQRSQFFIPGEFLRLTPDASLRKNDDGEVVLECDWHTYQPWQYLPDDVVRSEGHRTWPAGMAAKVFVAECMYQKYGYDRSKWDALALTFLRPS
jgi:hypothetical protein